MKVLIIEDNTYKIDQMLLFFEQEFKGSQVYTKKSYHSGLKEVIKNNTYDLILLDISMPNYDIMPGESGGDPMPLAGKLILTQMDIRDISAKVIVVTMYENFVDGTKLIALDKQFKEEFSVNYHGYVYFSPGNTNWKPILREKIKSIL